MTVEFPYCIIPGASTTFWASEVREENRKCETNNVFYNIKVRNYSG